VIFIEQENKSFDSILGESNHFQPFASWSAAWTLQNPTRIVVAWEHLRVFQ